MNVVPPRSLREAHEGAPVGLGEVAADPQPEPGARRLGHFAPVELREHRFELVVRNAGALVGHRDEGRRFVGVGIDAQPIDRRVFRAVLDEIREDLLDPIAVGSDERQLVDGHHTDDRGVRELDASDDVADERGQIDPLDAAARAGRPRCD